MIKTEKKKRKKRNWIASFGETISNGFKLFGSGVTLKIGSVRTGKSKFASSVLGCEVHVG